MKESVITAKADAIMYLGYLERKIEDYADKGDVENLKRFTIGMQLLMESAWWQASLPPN